MPKSLKQEQDELFAGLEDILPTKKELGWETGTIIRIQKYHEDEGRQQRKAEGAKVQGEKMKEKFADPAYKEKYIESRKRLHADPEFRKKLIEGNRRSAKDPVAHKNRVEAIRKSAKDPKIKEIRKEVGKKLSQNEEWCKAAGERNKQRCRKPIVTPEGIFVALRGPDSAAEHYNKIKNQKSTQNWLMNQIKNDPTNFYYITQEEYIMLTGKKI